MHILLSCIDDDRSQGTKIRCNMTAGLRWSVTGLCQADDEAVDAIGKVVNVLFETIKNESLASLIAVRHVVMHKNLHGLFLSDQRVDYG